MKRLVIFDLDGTLIDTIGDLGTSTNYALAQLGYPTHPLEAYKMMVGNGISKLVERALPPQAQTPENVNRMLEVFVPYYNGHNAIYSKPYEGIEEVLRSLRRQGIVLAVASNKYHEATSYLIPHYFPHIDFAVVYGHREGKPRKPDPTIVYDILDAAGVSREDTLYVGDSAVDMQTAQNAQVTACGVTWGFRSREELAAGQPAYLIDHPQEILGKPISD